MSRLAERAWWLYFLGDSINCELFEEATRRKPRAVFSEDSRGTGCARLDLVTWDSAILGWDSQTGVDCIPEGGLLLAALP
ncbi:unnamed protein product [Dibothriocephalus latus]|uniref:Uncharacterized protein n=1 Tax=Dibothriocephalus latus TaxID=60516 RepID=A0A3P7NW06_DIBLA|nr:unnamed protein product [Dibothriocephalus latus]